MDVVDRFMQIVNDVVWATLATIDPQDRPRSRVVHPLWERRDDGIVGWITTRRTPTKIAHLAHRPVVSVSYWSPAQSTAVAECAAGWVDSPRLLRHVWHLAEASPPPTGFDPASMYAGGPVGGDFALIRLSPWQLQVRTLDDLLAGRRPDRWAGTACRSGN